VSKTAELEARRAERKAAKEAARGAQYEKDLESVSTLEDVNGYELDISLRVSNFTDGLPSLVGVRAPSELEYKRYFQKLNRAGNADAKMQAHAEIAKCCWAYPADEDTRKAMMAANPGLMVGVGNLAIKLGEMQTEEEGKG
jgi:hypothetical protein